MRRVVLSIVLCACGARSEIAGSDIFDDASSSFDATKSDGSSGSDSPFGGKDAGKDAPQGDACTASTIAIGCATSSCANCKFDVEWTCGDTKFRVAGGCDPSTLFPDAGFLQGVCDENGKQTSTFKEPATTCECADASALLTVLQDQCQHQ